MSLQALDLRLERHAERPVAVALSGGGDSLALLLLATRWAQRNSRRLLALTVDHGLNPDSSRWTAEAGAAAVRLGVDWRPLCWTGAKPATGLPAAARRARHALLAEAARAAGAYVLLMGHTADDVAESALIRRDTPTHGRLEAWAPSPVWPEGRGVFLLRPLLQMRREALQGALREAGLSWLEDPANADPRFARTRARAALAKGEGGDLEPTPHGEPSRDEIRMDATGRVELSRATSADGIAKALLCASGREHPPAGDAVRRLAQRLAAGEGFRATLGGAKVLADGDKAVVVRDAGERVRGGLQPLALSPGRPTVFDGRFEVRTDVAGLQVHALVGLAGRLSAVDAAQLKRLPASVRPSLPVLLDSGGNPSLPAPFGTGAGHAIALGPRRLNAACGHIHGEMDAARDAIAWTSA